MRFPVRQVWTNNRMKNKFSSSVLHEGYIYGLDEAILACINAETGELKWKGGRYGYGQVLLAGGQLDRDHGNRRHRAGGGYAGAAPGAGADSRDFGQDVERAGAGGRLSAGPQCGGDGLFQIALSSSCPSDSPAPQSTAARCRSLAGTHNVAVDLVVMHHQVQERGAHRRRRDRLLIVHACKASAQ